MSQSQRIEGDRVYCHVCEHEWDRANGGLQCPACESEFVEIIESGSRPRPDSLPSLPSQPRTPQSPQSPNSLHDHNPWAPDPEEDDITTFEFNSGGGRGTFSFSSRSYTIGGGNMRTTASRDVAADEIGRSFETMLGNIVGFNPRRQSVMTGGIFQFPANRQDRIFGTPQPGHPPDLLSLLLQASNQRQQNQPPTAFDLFGAMFNPINARSGDTVFTQEAFDRVMTQLMEQNQSNSAPGPASNTAIAALRRKPVDESMMGSDGKAECSICMDSLDLGDEVTVLPCNHWFHGDCVISWLREHDTCPHCRKPITNPGDVDASSSSSSRRRRSSRRSSSVASPLSAVREDHDRGLGTPQDSPSGLRDARQRYYGRQRSTDLDTDRAPYECRSSDRSQRSTDNNNGSGAAGGVANWIRNRLPFSGQ